MTNMKDFLDWARNAQQNNLETRDQMNLMHRQQQHPLKPMEVTPSIEDAIRSVTTDAPAPENTVEESVEEVDEARQLKDPKKEVMVVKSKKVIVINKADLKKYTSKGWQLAESVEELDEAVTVEIDSLIKYLGMFPMVRLTVKNEKLVGENDIGDKNFELPLLNRHESNDVIYHFLEVFKDAPYNSKDTVLLSDDNKLNNGIRILTDELMMAFKECEAVGSSVYKLKWDGTNVLLSSSNNDESMEHLLEPISVNGDPFEVEFSGPVHTILEDSWNHTVNIHGGEHKPTLFTIGNDALYLIAPRME